MHDESAQPQEALAPRDEISRLKEETLATVSRALSEFERLSGRQITRLEYISGIVIVETS